MFMEVIDLIVSILGNTYMHNADENAAPLMLH